MFFSIVIWALIIYNIFRGFKNGIILELTRIISYVVALLVALTFADDLGKVISAFLPVTNFYIIHIISFIVLWSLVAEMLESVGRWLNCLSWFPVIHLLNSLGGAVIGSFVGCLIVVILLNLCSWIPSEWIHNQYQQSIVAQRIVQQSYGSDWLSGNRFK